MNKWLRLHDRRDRIEEHNGTTRHGGTGRTSRTEQMKNIEYEERRKIYENRTQWNKWKIKNKQNIKTGTGTIKAKHNFINMNNRNTGTEQYETGTVGENGMERARLWNILSQNERGKKGEKKGKKVME